MPTTCYALLDDASSAADGVKRSRLYRGHVATLRCDAAATWPALLAQLQQALRRGQHAVSLCSYELGAHLQELPVAAQASATTPLAQVLLFSDCQLLAPAEVTAWLATQAAEDGSASAGASASGPAGIAGVSANVDKAAFTAALARIHAYIEAGDTYQINYTYRLHFDAFGAPAALYARLRARQPVPYGALIVLPDGAAVLSLSPELFIAQQRGELTARPMKGTAPAAGGDAAQATPEHAQANASRATALAADPKNRAENLMIVDLLRNDMGRVGVTGTVRVPALFEVTRYGAVLQMTSTVRATLRPDCGLAEIFAALYPCGSITGAPKRRSMEIIAELEAAPRGLYTGAIGWFAPPAVDQALGDFCLSVPIRTLALAPPQAGVRRGEMGVGAGIVYDSVAADEYAECRLKARFLTGLENDVALFETMHASRGDGVRHVERHLARLAASAAYFGYPCDVAQLRAALRDACAGFGDAGPQRLRLALDQAGAIGISSAPLMPLAEPVRLLLAPDATLADDLFLRHKTTRRARYDAAWRAAEAQGAFDSLFFNQRGELTEGGRSNVFIELDGRWLTPPLACGVLPGVMRSVLLDDPAWAAQERVITRAMLLAAQKIIVCNALRGAVPATLP